MRNLLVISLFFAFGLLFMACKQTISNKLEDLSPVFADDNLTWYSIEDADKLVALEPKKIFVDVYTSWCGWCKVMDRNTFTDPEIIEHLKENYHLVKFNAEQKATLNFNGKSYEWINAGRRGVNKLAVQLLNGRLGYPTIVYLDENLNTIKVSPGYKDPVKLMNEMRNLKT